jgi:hypothetical protein
LAVIERDDAKAYLVESADFAAKDTPEITIETDTIDQLYREISTSAPEILHPNALQVEKKARLHIAVIILSRYSPNSC